MRAPSFMQLARIDERRFITACRHGLVHVTWGRITLRFSREEFKRLGGLVERAADALPPDSVHDGALRVTYRLDEDCELRVGPLALLLPPAEFQAFIQAVREAVHRLDQILAYDPVQDRVTTLPSTLPTATAYAAAVYDQVRNKIYLFGGWNPAAAEPYLDQIVAFDVASETATILSARLPSRRAKAAAVGIPGEGTAYIIGGLHEQGFPLGDVLRFDAATGTLTTTEDVRLAYPRYAEAAVYVPDQATAYLFGGTSYYGLGDVVKLHFAYPPSESAQSVRVNVPGEQVHQALLRVDQMLRGAIVDYSLSNDGGQTWASVQPGMKHVFASAGSDLRWRAVLSGNGETTPIVNTLILTYNGIEQSFLFLPAILKAH